jgi:hypothetical protein
MEMFRSGMYRNHGQKTLLRKEPDNVSVYWDKGTKEVAFNAASSKLKQGRASYRYGLRLEPRLLIEALLKVPDDQLRAAIGEIEEIDLCVLARKIGALALGSAEQNKTPDDDE